MDNVVDNLALTANGKYLVLGIMGFGVWKADISNIIILKEMPWVEIILIIVIATRTSGIVILGSIFIKKKRKFSQKDIE